MNFVDVGSDSMVNLDNVIYVERTDDSKSRIYVGTMGENVLGQIDYDTLRSIIISRNKSAQQSQGIAIESMARDMRQIAKTQTTPVP